MMGATEILLTLSKGEELTSAEISERVQCSRVAVMRSIKRLLRDVSENLEFRMLNEEEKIKRYGRNIGTRVKIYWLDE